MKIIFVKLFSSKSEWEEANDWNEKKEIYHD